MNSKRLEKLFSFLAEDPNDSFTLFAIALEYLSNQDKAAKKYLDLLLKDHPNYLATYYHAGQYYQQLHEAERAKDIYYKGIEVAKNQGNNLALRELQNALDQLLFEDDI